MAHEASSPSMRESRVHSDSWASQSSKSTVVLPGTWLEAMGISLASGVSPTGTDQITWRGFVSSEYSHMGAMPGNTPPNLIVGRMSRHCLSSKCSHHITCCLECRVETNTQHFHVTAQWRLLRPSRLLESSWLRYLELHFL